MGLFGERITIGILQSTGDEVRTLVQGTNPKVRLKGSGELVAGTSILRTHIRHVRIILRPIEANAIVVMDQRLKNISEGLVCCWNELPRLAVWVSGLREIFLAAFGVFLVNR